MTFWREKPDGVTIQVKVHPRSKHPGLHGVQDSASGLRLKIAVPEAAEDGAANDAVRALLARALECPASSIRIAAGASHREKLLAIKGQSDVLAAKLRTLCPPG